MAFETLPSEMRVATLQIPHQSSPSYWTGTVGKLREWLEKRFSTSYAYAYELFTAKRLQEVFGDDQIANDEDLKAALSIADTNGVVVEYSIGGETMWFAPQDAPTEAVFLADTIGHDMYTGQVWFGDECEREAREFMIAYRGHQQIRVHVLGAKILL